MFGWFKKEQKSRTDEVTQAAAVAIQSDMSQQITVNDVLLLEKAGDFRKVIVSCALWATQQPQSPLPYLSSGNAHRNIGKPLDSIEMYRKAIEIATKSSDPQVSSFGFVAQCWYGLGHAYFQLRRRSDAEYAFLQAGQLDPTAPDIWNDLGVVYLNLEPYDTSKAFDAFKKAVVLDSKHIRALTNIGFIYAICGEDKGVTMIYGDLEKIENGDAQGFLRLATQKLKEAKAGV
ncbi:Tetratricopeptide repeat 2 [Comamonadaceae bacterium]